MTSLPQNSIRWRWEGKVDEHVDEARLATVWKLLGLDDVDMGALYYFINFS